MTERKPPGVSFESWVEKQISEATARGDFADLPGAGKPLPGAGVPDDEHCRLRGYLRREAADSDALLPPSVLLRKRVERLPDTVRDLRTEHDVREAVERLNAQIRDSWRGPAGPQPPLRLVNADAVLLRWRADRAAAAPGEPVAPAGRNAGGPPRARRWWGRVFRPYRRP